MLIDTTYFVLELAIANSDKALQMAKITEAISTYEDEILLRVLGYPLYLSYKDDATTDRFKDLIDGKSFSFVLDGKTVTRPYPGLKTKGQSFIACYVYYQYQANNVTSSTGAGEVEAKTENANRASLNDKMVRAINKASDLIGQDFPAQKLDLESYQHSNDAASLFNYLLANKAIFPEWEFTPLKKINVFGF